MGGGNGLKPNKWGSIAGLSPRGRGKLPQPRLYEPATGSIPAWAGETLSGSLPLSGQTVYPRVGGGNAAAVRPIAAAVRPRSIPAWAGETGSSSRSRAARSVYPRVGGGNSSLTLASRLTDGLSPRGRGKRLACCNMPSRCRSIPAWAGETKRDWRRYPMSRVYPRVGGGNPAAGSLPPAPYRSIPAWAGETLWNRKDVQRYRVYPRVGGGNAEFLLIGKRGNGLSPRGRGKQVCMVGADSAIRSIPAWAGETSNSA